MKLIAITIDLRNGLWANGINQNAIYLANLLKEIGYSVHLIHSLEEESNDINGIKALTLKKSYNIPYSLVIQLGFTVTKKMFDNFKKKKSDVKMVAYQCGNYLIVDMESILFDATPARTISQEDEFVDPAQKPHQIWSIPQMEKTNLEYYSFIQNQSKATVVPFIWESMSVEEKCKEYDLDIYTPRKIEKLGIMEPNLSVMKNTLIPIAVVEKEYKEFKNLNAVMMIGAERIKKSQRLLQILKKTNLLKDNIITADARINTVQALKNYIDIVFSWQWENNLNYLWLDVAWLGFPIIHNGNLCQDIGYYYPDFNISAGQKELHKAITSHNDDTEYLNRNRAIISRYTSKNDNLKSNYKKLIENVINNKFEKYSYDWKNNSII
jgi:hypothetical protein